MSPSRLFVATASLLLAFTTLASATALDLTKSRLGEVAHNALANHLRARQSAPLDPTTFPPQCRQTCTPIINTLNTCNGRSANDQLPCLCTNTNGLALKGCLDCLVEVIPSQSQVDQAQEVLDTFSENCSAYDLPPYTITNPNAPPQSSRPPASVPSGPSVPPTPGPSTPPTVPSRSVSVPPPTPSPPRNPSPSVVPPPTPSQSGNNNGNGNGNGFERNGAISVVGTKGSSVALGIVLGLFIIF